MALNSLSFLVVFALLAVTSSAALGGRKDLAPAPAPASFPADLGFTPLDSKSAKAVELGKFAIDEYNKVNKGNLAFEAVLEAIAYDNENQGTNYEVVVLASTDKQVFNSYISKIVVSQSGQKLTSFEEGQ
ncbi:hypothetical protein C2S52_007265 [Perilla frutescens var. hirtella]|nr:hypothetical protein C2S51_008613 [Perilla frutescens var. frutescens]KAH6787713.1 hypothetical protein C2S52_007265 [Perilla frutescens var. hirtella]